MEKLSDGVRVSSIQTADGACYSGCTKSLLTLVVG